MFPRLLVVLVFFSCAFALGQKCDPSATRTPCGYVGVAEEECEKNLGCCWDTGVAPYCFTPVATSAYEETFTFDGSPSFCSQCGNPGQYACSDKSNWNDGKFDFKDQTPEGSVPVSITVVITGSFACQGDTVDDIGAYINDFLIDIDDVERSDDFCACGTCDGEVSFTSSQKYGLPVNKGGNNTIQIKNYYNEICLNTVKITVSYEKDNFGFEVFTTSAVYQTGASSVSVSPGMCGYTLARGIYGGGGSFSEARYSFTDPLPKDYFLVAANFRVYGRFFYDQGHCQSNATLNVSMGKVDPMGRTEDKPVLTPPENPDVCIQSGCDHGWQFESSVLYQNGWPGYNYGSTNSLYLDDEGAGRIDVARVDAILWAYPNP